MRKNVMYIILFFTLFLATGCTVQYDLYFGEDTIEENIMIDGNRNEVNNENIDYFKKHPISALMDNLDEKYTLNIDEQRNKVTGHLTYNYTYDNFRKANLIRPCYDAIGFVEDENYYLLLTSQSFHCMTYEYTPLDKVQVNIHTNHIVLEHNADQVSNGTYTWNINNENADKNQIKFQISKELDPEFLKKEKKQMYILYGGIFSFILVIVFGIILYMINKNKKNNAL